MPINSLREEGVVGLLFFFFFFALGKMYVTHILQKCCSKGPTHHIVPKHHYWIEWFPKTCVGDDGIKDRNYLSTASFYL